MKPLILKFLCRLKVGLTAMACFPALAVAHARLTPESTILPRSNADNNKVAPCGPAPETTPQTFIPGTTVKLKWEETIQHPGRFEVHFSKDGLDFAAILLAVEDTKNGTGDLPHKYEANVTLPKYECDSCVLQFVQVMTDRTPPSNYYSCADVRLSLKATPSSTPVPNPVQPKPEATLPQPETAVPPENKPTVAVPSKTLSAAPAGLKIEWKKEEP